MIPESPLYLLEQDLPLPLGCEEPNEIEMRMPLQIRMQYHFFLADTSLRMILARITNVSSSPSENKSRDHHRLPDVSSSTALLSELRQQLDEWEAHVPIFLQWSSSPGRGIISPVGTRLKLTYWFSRLQISRPAIETALHDQHARLSVLEWSLLQQGVSAAIDMVKTFVLEKASIDVLSGNRYAQDDPKLWVCGMCRLTSSDRILGAICLLRDVKRNQLMPDMASHEVDSVVEVAMERIWTCLAPSSEWITCILHNL